MKLRKRNTVLYSIGVSNKVIDTSFLIWINLLFLVKLTNNFFTDRLILQNAYTYYFFPNFFQ